MEPKPGIRTTEFWVTLLTALVGPGVALLVGFGVFDAELDQEATTDTLTSLISTISGAVVAAVGLITGAVSARRYSENRMQVKTAAVTAGAQ